jgi:hypothetical protein
MNQLQATLGAFIARILTIPLDIPPVLPLDIHVLRDMLQPGDVILVEGNLRISAVIKYLTQSTWSHSVLYTGKTASGMPGFDCIEADVIEGVRWVPLEDLLVYHTRICRPIGLSDDERQKVIDYAVSKIGTQYDLRYIIDLARYLFPLPLPGRWRRQALGFLSADPTRAICSTLIASAFQSIGYPILQEIDPQMLQSEPGRALMHEIYHIHNNGLFVPRDFDVSPFFEVIKPDIPHKFDHHRLVWVE